MSRVWSFEAAQAKYLSKDHYEQGDAAGDAFDEWYKVAKLYAKGELENGVPVMVQCTLECLKVLMADNVPTLLHDSATEDYVIRAMMDNLRKLLQILRTKSKFTQLVFRREAMPVAKYVQKDMLPRLVAGATRSAINYTSRIEFLKTIRELIDMGNDFDSQDQKSWLASHFEINLKPFLAVAASTNAPQLHREAVFDMIAALTRLHGMGAARDLAAVAMDAAAFEAMWAMGALDDKQVVKKVQDRVKKAIAGARHDTMPLELMFSLHSAIKAETISVGTHMETLIALVRLCDAAKSVYKEDVRDGDDGERSQEVLELLTALLREEPDSQDLLKIAISPLTIESINLVQGMADFFSEQSWRVILLPRIDEAIAMMKLDGVSGEQLEQEVINLLRDCIRVFYINEDRTPSPALGKQVFYLIIEAMRRGYVETERFPYLGALVLRRHIDDGSEHWIDQLFSADVSRNHKTVRAVSELLLNILGVNMSADITMEESSDEVCERVLAVVARTPSAGAMHFVMNLLRENQAFLMAREKAVLGLIDGLTAHVDDMLKSGRLDRGFLDTLVEFASIISIHIAPSAAVALFNLLVKAFVMIRKVSPNATNYQYLDEALVRVVAKVPAGSTLSTSAVDQAMRIGGPSLRMALTAFVPWKLLRDADANVRAEAMRVMVRRPDFLPQHAKTILDSVQQGSSTKGGLNMDDVMLARASAPLLGHLCVRHSASIVTAIPHLLTAAALSKQNDPQGKVGAEIVAALDMIVEDGNFVDVAKYIKSREGLKQLKALESISQAWGQRIAELVSSGHLKRDLTGGYSATRQALGHTDAAAAAKEVIDTMYAHYEAGRLMQALRAAHQVKTSHPEEYESSIRAFVTGTLLPQIATSELPTPDEKASVDGKVVFKKKVLKDYETYNKLLTEIISLFPMESVAIRALDRLRHLNTAMVQSFLDKKQPDKAREFLDAHYIHSPELVSLIDRFEEQSKSGGASKDASIASTHSLPPPSYERATSQHLVYRATSAENLLEPPAEASVADLGLVQLQLDGPSAPAADTNEFDAWTALANLDAPPSHSPNRTRRSSPPSRRSSNKRTSSSKKEYAYAP